MPPFDSYMAFVAPSAFGGSWIQNVRLLGCYDPAADLGFLSKNIPVLTNAQAILAGAAAFHVVSPSPTESIFYSESVVTFSSFLICTNFV